MAHVHCASYRTITARVSQLSGNYGEPARNQLCNRVSSWPIKGSPIHIDVDSVSPCKFPLGNIKIAQQLLEEGEV